jgi:HEAT repeats
MPTRYLLPLLLMCGLVLVSRAAPPDKPVADKAPPDKPATDKPPADKPPVGPTISAEDEKLLKERKIATDGPVLLEYFKKRSLDAKNLEGAGDLIKQLGDDDYFVREKATDDLRKRGASIVPMLRRATNDPDEEVKDRAQTLILALEGKTNPTLSQAVLRALRVKAPDGAVQVLFDYLPTADNEITEDEVFNTLAVLGVKDGKVDKILEDALKDKNPTRRSAAGLVLGRSGTADQKKAAQALLTDADTTVRFRAAQGLLAGHDRAAVPVLCTLVGEGPMNVATHAEELLQCLAGTQPPRTPPFSDDAAMRKRSRQIWEEWWKTNSKMDLTKAEVDLAPFNISLKSRELIRQYGAALMINDVEAMKKTVGFPFLAYGNQPANTREETDRYVEGNNLPGRGQQGTLVIMGTVSRDKYLQTPANNVQPNEKTFLEEAGKTGQVRLYNVYIAYNPQINPNPGEEFTLYIKVSKDGQMKIIGFGQPRGRTMIEKW